MNEVPSMPESDNFNNDAREFQESTSISAESSEMAEETTSETNFDDAWLDAVTNEDDRADNVIDVAIDSELDLTNSDRESEPESALPTIELESEPTTDLNDSEQQTEILAETDTVDSFTTSEIVEPAEKTVEQSSNTSQEPELFADSWLDEPQNSFSNGARDNSSTEVDRELTSLEKQKTTLQAEIKTLQAQKEELLVQQAQEVRENLARLVEAGTKELQERKTSLQIEIEKLERRKERIEREMRANFAGSSQELAMKVQGFKEYLVGSLQDLARTAEKLDLAKTETPPSATQRRSRDRYEGDRDDRGAMRATTRDSRDSRRDSRDSRNRYDSRSRSNRQRTTTAVPQGQFSESAFADRDRQIRQLIDKFRNNPDYYGEPWQLRRTFETVHAKKVQDWFFVQGGRGAIDSMGSRLQNILVASAAISILHNLHGDRCRFLVLTDTPENLGEWRRGLQDCLGISRSNFGSNRGITLFDAPEVVIQRAERLLDEKLLPIIIIDETEELLNLSVLKFPIWLAFASNNKQTTSNYLY